MKRRLWDIRKYLVEIRTGSFFLVAFILLFIALISMRELSFFKGTYILKVRFNFAEGMRAASPIRFCGVDIGEVKEVMIQQEDNQPVVYVYAKIQNGVQIPRNANFFINSLSLFGEKYLEITPPLQITDYYKEGDTAEGISPTPLFHTFNSFNKTMNEVTEFVKDGKIRTSIENTVSNVEELTADLKKNPWKLLHMPRQK
jgi:phospholipid/cholesterol/gamma-HCH transport system substrate-binding protein